MHELQRAAYEAEVYENRIELLLSVHKESSQAVDWDAILRSDAPVMPKISRAHEETARARLERFEGSIFNKLLRPSDSKHQQLLRGVEEARQADFAEYQQVLQDYDREYAEWEATHEFAAKVVEGNPHACVDAIKSTDPFRDISELGSSIDFKAEAGGLVEAILHVRGDEVIPAEEKRLLRSGRLSVRQMSETRRYELHRKYVCSCVLRVAREVFALVPLEMVLVHAMGNVLNSQTGYVEEQPIVSVAIARKTLERLNFESLDASDSMSNFVHRTAFRKGKGFSAVAAVTPSDLRAPGVSTSGEETYGRAVIEEARRRSIPQRVRTYVWRRDGGRCVQCGSREGLEFDHIVPVSKGGSNTARNIQLLCETCNREKSDSV